MNVEGGVTMTHLQCNDESASGGGTGSATFQGAVVCHALDTDIYKFKTKQLWLESTLPTGNALVLNAPTFPIFKCLDMHADTVTTDKLEPLDDGDNTLLMSGYDNIALHADRLTVPKVKLTYTGAANSASMAYLDDDSWMYPYVNTVDADGISTMQTRFAIVPDHLKWAFDGTNSPVRGPTKRNSGMEVFAVNQYWKDFANTLIGDWTVPVFQVAANPWLCTGDNNGLTRPDLEASM